jgi:O-acetyl-ADP-ribose deacetylase (regulator of RNase III)
MNNYTEVFGNLITLAKDGEFDVIAHGCNCMCTMGAGLAPHMASAFGCDLFKLENTQYRGDINKLGQIDGVLVSRADMKRGVFVLNAYTQYKYGRNHADGDAVPVDYDAITLCMRKINHNFKGMHIGLPMIGAGLAGGDWEKIKQIIKRELKDCIVTIVILKK